MCKLDMKDAYFCVSVAQEHRPFLRFVWQGRTFQFRCLPFGLASCPRTFTKLLKPVMAILRRVGMKAVIYLDDLLLMNESRQGLLNNRDTAIWLLTSLGFVINMEKSVLVPSQKLEYLGFLIDSRDMLFSLPHKKVVDIKTNCVMLLNSDVVTVRDVAKVTGRLTACAAAVLSAPLHYRHLQMQPSCMRFTCLCHQMHSRWNGIWDRLTLFPLFAWSVDVWQNYTKIRAN